MKKKNLTQTNNREDTPMTSTYQEECEPMQDRPQSYVEELTNQLRAQLNQMEGNIDTLARRLESVMGSDRPSAPVNQGCEKTLAREPGSSNLCSQLTDLSNHADTLINTLRNIERRIEV
jgi:hypothetical protein